MRIATYFLDYNRDFVIVVRVRGVRTVGWEGLRSLFRWFNNSAIDCLDILVFHLTRYATLVQVQESEHSTIAEEQHAHSEGNQYAARGDGRVVNTEGDGGVHGDVLDFDFVSIFLDSSSLMHVFHAPLR